MSKVIEPTVGRAVWYRAANNEDIHDGSMQPFAATVVWVWSDRMVNLTVHDHNGGTHKRTSVPLVQPGDEVPSGSYCTWMPYQVGQAEKTEELRQALVSGGEVDEAHPG